MKQKKKLQLSAGILMFVAVLAGACKKGKINRQKDQLKKRNWLDMGQVYGDTDSGYAR